MMWFKSLRQVWRRRSLLPVLVYCTVAGLILGPALGRGYILTLDMVFTPWLPRPEAMTNTYVLNWLLYGAGQLLPADVVQKLLLLIILTLTGWGGYRLAAMALAVSRQRAGLAPAVGLAGWLPAYAAGLLYVCNPFVYDRLMAGQYLVLAGVAVLPWAVVAWWRWLETPNWRTAGLAVGWATVLAGVSLHSIVPFGLVVAALSAVYIGKSWHSTVSRLGGLLAIVVSWLVLQSYWLWPLLTGRAPAAQTLASFTAADQLAFATVGGSPLQRILNAIVLQGFWAAGRGLHASPQAWSPGLWFWTVLVLLALVVLGGVVLWRRRQQRWLLVWLTVITAGLLLAVGLAGWLSGYAPLLAGYREPQKFVMLIVLGYCVLLAFAAERLVQCLTRRGRWFGRLAAAWLLLLPVALTPTLLWAGGGQLRTSAYPVGWYAVSARLQQTGQSGRHDASLMVLPWHLYLRSDFAGRVVAQPAALFFQGALPGWSVVSSQDPEFRGVAAVQRSDATTAVSRAVSDQLAGDRRALAREADRQGVGYIVLTKDTDFQRYQSLDADGSGWRRLYDDQDISLYSRFDN